MKKPIIHGNKKIKVFVLDIDGEIHYFPTDSLRQQFKNTVKPYTDLFINEFETVFRLTLSEVLTTKLNKEIEK